MTSAETGELSTISNAESNETSVEKHPLRRCLSLTHADQEDTTSVSRISELLKVTEEPQEEILKHDLEIPPEAKITSIPLSAFPPKMQQVMSARAKNVFETRQATEIPTVTYIWPVIKVEGTSRPFWDNFRKSSVPTSLNLARCYSGPDDVVKDMKCIQMTPVNQLGQEEPDRNTARSYSLILKSSNSVVSGILKSLANINNKDCKSMLPPSSTSPIGKQLEIPLFKGNAVVIYNRQVYVLCVMTYEHLPPDVEMHDCVVLIRTTVWLIACTAISNIMIEAPHPLQSREYVVEQNTNPLTAPAPPTLKGKTSTRLSSHRTTTISQPKQWSYSTRKRQEFLSKTAFPSKGSLQKRNGKEAYWGKDNEVRKKFGIVKDVRVYLNRIRLPEITEGFGNSSAPKWKVPTRTKKWERAPRCAKAVHTQV